jgi:hypothetical protein
MTTLREAAQQALEFVEYHSRAWNGVGTHPQEIVTALRDALAQQEQAEPAYSTEGIDLVTHALTGYEGEEDALTELKRVVRYVQKVWPGKTALKVLEDHEECAMAQQERAEPIPFAYYWPPTNTLRRNPAYFLAITPVTVLKAELPLFFHPPRREWQGLTEDEIWACNQVQTDEEFCHICVDHQHVPDFARAIEAKLREKNA